MQWRILKIIYLNSNNIFLASEIQQNTISTSSDLDNNDTPTEDDKKDATTNQPTVKQEPDVKSKEKHLRILVSEFPHIDTMVNDLFKYIFYCKLYILSACYVSKMSFFVCRTIKKIAYLDEFVILITKAWLFFLLYP